MTRPNDQVAALAQEYADLIAITGEQFKAHVYEKVRFVPLPRLVLQPLPHLRLMGHA